MIMTIHRSDTCEAHEELKVLKLSSKFHIHQVLGKGAFATVFLAQHRRKNLLHTEKSNKREIALKIINLHKIAARRRPRQLGDDDRNGITMSEMEEDDTEELFFPSRLEKRALDKNVCDDLEMTTVKNMIQMEINVHSYASKLRHPNIVSLLESFHYSLPGKNHLVAAMAIEYCPLGDLHFYLKRKRDKMKNRCGSEEIESNRHTLLEENEAKYAMRHILRGLAFLHSHGIAHRDIKPGNILLKRRDGVKKKFDNGNFSLAECTLKIGDFGLAVKMSDEDDWDETHDTLCGTPSCLAPEIARCTPKRPRQSPNITSGNQMDNQVKKYGQPADLWSTGCLLFVMLVGRYPFSPQHNMGGDDTIDKERRVRETIGRAVQGQWEIPNELVVSSPARSLINILLSLDPKDRGFARGLLSTHLFFRIAATRTCKLNLNVSLAESKKKRAVSERASFSVAENMQVHYDVNCPTTIPNLWSESNFETPEKMSKMQCKVKKLPPSSSQNAQTSRFLNPLRDLSKLLPAKYDWKECNLKRNVNGRVKTLHYTLFVLPKSNGIVIHCEREEDSSGAFMHVTGDGAKVLVGKLGSRPVAGNCSNNKQNDLIYEAFQRRPLKSRHTLFPAHSHGVDNRDEQTTFMHQTPSQSTLHSLRTTQSLPTINGREKASKFYRPLSRLLRPKYRTHLSLFQKVEGIVSTISRQLSTFSIHVHHYRKSVNITHYNAGNQICAVTTPHNDTSRFIFVSFKDGVKIQYDPHCECGQIQDESKIIGRIFLDRATRKLVLVGGDSNPLYSFHLIFVHEAIKKCVEICKQIMPLMNERQCAVPFVLVAKGQSSSEWQIMER